MQKSPIKTATIMEYITEDNRIYAVGNDGKAIAEVTFPTRDGISTIDHTFVDDSLRGQGVAGTLVKLAADKILADGNRIAVTCPYAVIWSQRHPEYPVVNGGSPAACKLPGPQ